MLSVVYSVQKYKYKSINMLIMVNGVMVANKLKNPQTVEHVYSVAIRVYWYMNRKPLQLTATSKKCSLIKLNLPFHSFSPHALYELRLVCRFIPRIKTFE